MAYPIYPVEGTPYTNLHDLNLDWILQRVKEAYEAYKSLDETVDKSVRAYMESPEFIAALQDIVSEEFITETVIQQIKRQLTVVNVADYGATGDGSDQTEAIAAAFEAFNADPAKTEIYFPRGSYRYTTGFSVANRDIWLHGDHARIIPTRAVVGSDTINTFFTSSIGGHIKISGTVFRDYINAAGSETAVRRKPEPLFSIKSPAELVFTDNHLADVVQRYSTLSTTAGPLWLEVTSNAGPIRFCDNEVTGAVGDMEIVTISPNTYTAGICTCTGNWIHDCNMFGSILNIKGGVIVFNDNIFDNAAYPVTVNNGGPGSLVNLLGYNVSAIGNVVTADNEHISGNFIDTTEAGRNRASNTLIANNIIKAPIRAAICDGSHNLDMTGNEIYNTYGIALRTYIRAASVEQTAESRQGKYGTLRVANNNLQYNPRSGATGLGSGALYLGNLYRPDPDNQPQVWEFNCYEVIEISNNIFRLAGLPNGASGLYTDCAPPVQYMSIPDELIVSGNMFFASGTPAVNTNRVSYINQARASGTPQANNARTSPAHFRIYNNIFHQTLTGTPATVYISAVYIVSNITTYEITSEGSNNTLVDACSLTPFLCPTSTELFNNGQFHYQTS